MWTQIFKSGKHTDRGGNTREWSDSDLEKIVKLYNDRDVNNTHIAPVVVGHPAADKPAYGWVEKLRKVGNFLEAKFKNVDAAFADLVNAGRYKNISIALYPDLRLRHVGFLGAVPPAIKGLKEPIFEDDNAEIIQIETQREINFNNEKKEFSMNDEMLADLIAFAKSKFGPEVASELERYLAGEKPDTEKPEPEKPAPENSETQQTETEMSERNLTVEQLEMKKRNAVRNAFNIAARSGEFSAADGAGAIKTLIESFPKRVEFGEFANKAEAPGDNADLNAQSEWIENHYKGVK